MFTLVIIFGCSSLHLEPHYAKNATLSRITSVVQETAALLRITLADVTHIVAAQQHATRGERLVGGARKRVPAAGGLARLQ